MGRRGPPPKDPELKAFEGNPGHRKIDEVPELHAKLANVPEPANYLDDLAAAVFIDIATLLFQAGRLTDADIQSIELYSDSFAQWVYAIRRRDAYAAENDGDYLDKHIKRVRELSSDCNRWSRVLGIGPTYRAGLNVHFGLGGEKSNDDHIDDPILKAVCG